MKAGRGYRRLRTLICAIMAWPAAGAVAQQKSEIAITQQPGIIFVTTSVMQEQRLIEKKAAALGVPDLKVNWISFSTGNAVTDALLAGRVDVANTGTGNLLLLWDRTRGAVKGIVATSTAPMSLVTRNPAIKSLADYKDGDKIAVPGVKISTQAVILQIAAAQAFGEDEWGRMDNFTVQLGNPDAAAALMNSQHEVTSAFSIPPFLNQIVKRVPDARVVIRSQDVMGGPLTNSTMFTTARFAEDNPKLVRAIRDAVAEAGKFVAENPEAAVAIYKARTGDSTPADELVAILKDPGVTFVPKPQGTMKFAMHLHKIGTLKTRPNGWADFFLAESRDLDGN